MGTSAVPLLRPHRPCAAHSRRGVPGCSLSARVAGRLSSPPSSRAAGCGPFKNRGPAVGGSEDSAVARRAREDGRGPGGTQGARPARPSPLPSLRGPEGLRRLPPRPGPAPARAAGTGSRDAGVAAGGRREGPGVCIPGPGRRCARRPHAGRGRVKVTGRGRACREGPRGARSGGCAGPGAPAAGAGRGLAPEDAGSPGAAPSSASRGSTPRSPGYPDLLAVSRRWAPLPSSPPPQLPRPQGLRARGVRRLEPRPAGGSGGGRGRPGRRSGRALRRRVCGTRERADVGAVISGALPAADLR